MFRLRYEDTRLRPTFLDEELKELHSSYYQAFALCVPPELISAARLCIKRIAGYHAQIIVEPELLERDCSGPICFVPWILCLDDRQYQYSGCHPESFSEMVRRVLYTWADAISDLLGGC